MFKGKKKMSGLVFGTALAGALFMDTVLGVVPFLGTMYVGFCRVTFWLIGYADKNTLTGFFTSAALEAFPLLPASTYFILDFKAKNHAAVAELKAQKQEEEKAAMDQQKKLQRRRMQFLRQRQLEAQIEADAEDAQAQILEFQARKSLQEQQEMGIARQSS